MNTLRNRFIIISLIIIVGALTLDGIYVYQKNRQTPKALNSAAELTASSSVAGWNTYTNSDFGISLNYPSSYGTPTYFADSTSIDFGSPSSSGDGGMDTFLSMTIGVNRDFNDGHILSVSEIMADHPSPQPITIDGKLGLTYSSSQIGTITNIPLQNGEVFSTTLDPRSPIDNQIIASIKFLPRNPQTNFKLHVGSAIDTLDVHRGETSFFYSIFGKDIDSVAWNGRWNLRLDCPKGVTIFSYGALMQCNGVSNQERWAARPATGGWLINTTNEAQQVKATAQLIDDNDATVATDQVIVSVPPSSPKGSTIFSVASLSPASAKAPLKVEFTAIKSAGAESIDYGDGSDECWMPNYDGEASCDMLSHTYAKPGTYTAILSRHLPTTELARLTIAVY